MAKDRMFYIILLFALINLILLMMIFIPQLKRIQHQVKDGGAVPVGVFIPTFNDFYYDYVLVETHTEGEWQIDTYEEVKRLVDTNGQKIKDVPTGNFEYMRYFIGDDPDDVLYDLLEEEDHELTDHDHSR